MNAIESPHELQSRFARRLRARSAAWLVAGAGVASAQDLPPASVEAAVDETADRRAFVEIAIPKDTVFVHESVRVTVRVGVDAERFDQSAVQLFRSPLDVPVQLDAGWLRGTADAPVVAVPPRRDAAARPFATLALGEEIERARRMDDEVRDGRKFRVLEIERALRPAREGALELSAPTVRFAYATRFREDLLDGRVALDRHDALVRGEPYRVRVLALPEAGRPIEFAGAVGRFEVHAEASSTHVNVGDGVVLALRVEGDGNFGGFPAPRLDALDGFAVRGTFDESDETRLAVTYDLVPAREDVREIPPIAFAFFDPTPPGAYRVVKTEPIPLRVLPAGKSPSLRPNVTQPDDGPVVPGSPHFPGAGFAAAGSVILIALVVLALIVLMVLGFGMVLALRRRSRDARDPEGARARAAADAFDARVRIADSDVGEAFTDYLAARLRCTRAAVIAPDLEARLVSANVPAELAGRAHRFVDAHVGARYGGAPHDGADEALSLVDELEAAFEREVAAA